jgi:hypothetical protein
LIFAPLDIGDDNSMSTDVIGSRYRLGGVVACTPEVTTWQALDTWLDEGVLVVTPEPGCSARFAALSDAVMDRASTHLLRLYDTGTAPEPFIVFDVPNSTFAESHAPREEEDVLAAGLALGDALEALHGRGVVLGELHPGSIVLSAAGEAALSPWPLARRPENWSGPGGFGSPPDERPNVCTQDDLRALGAVLLGALAGPPLLSNQQVDNLERELADRARSAVAIADRALTPSAQGGYEQAAELRDDCQAALSGIPVGVVDVAAEPRVVDPSNAGVVAGDSALSEGRRAALVVAAAGAAVLAGLGVSGALGAHPGLGVRPVTGHAGACVARPSPAQCNAPDRSAPNGLAAPMAAAGSGTGSSARLADHPVVDLSTSTASPAASTSAGASAPANASNPSVRPSATSTTTTQDPGTTTTSPPATSSTTTSTPSPTTTSPSTSTTTTAPPSTTTSSSNPNTVEAGSSDNGASLPGPSGPAGVGGPKDYVLGSGQGG